MGFVAHMPELLLLIHVQQVVFAVMQQLDLRKTQGPAEVMQAGEALQHANRVLRVLKREVHPPQGRRRESAKPCSTRLTRNEPPRRSTSDAFVNPSTDRSEGAAGS